MSLSLKNLRLSQVDKALADYRPLLSRNAPRRGWIREIRRALGMTEAQLGKRIGIAQSSVAELEASEAEGTISLISLRRLAKALDAELVYAIVPRRSLANALRLRIEEFARDRLTRVGQTMRLEDQAVPADALERRVEDLVQELMEKPPRSIWD